MKKNTHVFVAALLGVFIFAPIFAVTAHAADLEDGGDIPEMSGDNTNSFDLSGPSGGDNTDSYDLYGSGKNVDNTDSYDLYGSGKSADNTDSYDLYSSDEPIYSDGGGSYGSSGGGSSGGSWSSGGGSSGGSSSRGSYSFPSSPISFSAPTNYATYIPTYTTPHTTYTQPTTTTNNTCVNNSCNNYIDNSINNSGNTVISNSGNTVATVYPVATTPVQYPVQYIYPTTYAQPYCSITLSGNTNNAYGPYSYNQLATLTWSSTNATSGYISPTVGSVSSYGSMTVYPTSGQIYSMTVYGNGGTANCQTTSYYAPIHPIVQNPTPYVSLTQIPYTGFDFGALGNSIYWLSLMAFAGAAAYLVLYFQGGALAFAGQFVGTTKKRVSVEMPRIQVSKAAPIATPAPIVSKQEVLVKSPIQIQPVRTVEFRLPVADVHNSTNDTMNVIHSASGEAPRIVITRA